MSPTFKSGYIAVVGRPNVGKSTLINALLGEELLAVTPKPQTTRHKILGIKSVPAGQMLFLDTPGIHRPHKALNQAMVDQAKGAISDADLCLLVIDGSQGWTEEEGQIHKTMHGPLILVINKADLMTPPQLSGLVDQLSERFPGQPVVAISSLKAKNLDTLEARILEQLPEGPAYYPEDQLSDRQERFFTAEAIRAQVLREMGQEIPYATTVLIEQFREQEPDQADPRKVYIRAAIIVEKDSQKGMVIGKGGRMIRKIGEGARKKIEARLGRPVFLELFVRVERDWTKQPAKVREFEFVE